MRKLALVVILIALLSLPAEAESSVILRLKDPRGDDHGGGKLAYPQHEVYLPGLFDLLKFELAQGEGELIFDFQFAELTNPFGAPEGYFHQRLEVYIRTGAIPGSESITVGPYTLATAPGQGWDLRLSIAPFGESKLYRIGAAGEPVLVEQGFPSSVLPDGRTIRIQLPSSLVPQVSPAWGFYILVGAFDGLAPDYWRDHGEGPWQVGGEGVPVFDLLAPRWGPLNQRNQLTGEVLSPQSGGGEILPWLWGGVVVVVAVGLFLWRWISGRT